MAALLNYLNIAKFAGAMQAWAFFTQRLRW